MEGKALYGALRALKPVLKAAPLTPHFQAVQLVKNGNGTIHVRATSLEVYADVLIPGFVKEHCAANHKELLEAVKPFRKEGIALLLDSEGGLSVDSTEGGRTCVDRFPWDDLPAWPAFPGEYRITVGADDWKRAVAATAFSASTEKQRYALNGVHLEIANGRFSVVSTDGKRLSEWSTALYDDREDWKVTIPTIAAEFMATMAIGPIRIEQSTDYPYVTFRSETATSVCRSVEGDFPARKELFPKSGFEALLDRKALVRALDVVKPRGKKDDPEFLCVRLTFDSSQSADGWCQVETGWENKRRSALPILEMSDRSCPRIGLSCTFLLEAVKAFRGDSIRLTIPGKLRAIQLSDPDEPGYRHILMPIDID